MTIKIDKFAVDKLAGKLVEINGTPEISTDDIMTNSFIQRNTRFNNWQDLLRAGGVKTSEDILDSKFSKFIARNSRFNSFNDMAEAAGLEYLKIKLNV